MRAMINSVMLPKDWEAGWADLVVQVQADLVMFLEIFSVNSSGVLVLVRPVVVKGVLISSTIWKFLLRMLFSALQKKLMFLVWKHAMHAVVLEQNLKKI